MALATSGLQKAMTKRTWKPTWVRCLEVVRIFVIIKYDRNFNSPLTIIQIFKFLPLTALRAMKMLWEMESFSQLSCGRIFHLSICIFLVCYIQMYLCLWPNEYFSFMSYYFCSIWVKDIRSKGLIIETSEVFLPFSTTDIALLRLIKWASRVCLHAWRHDDVLSQPSYRVCHCYCLHSATFASTYGLRARAFSAYALLLICPCFSERHVYPCKVLIVSNYTNECGIEWTFILKWVLPFWSIYVIKKNHLNKVTFQTIPAGITRSVVICLRTVTRRYDFYSYPF